MFRPNTTALLYRKGGRDVFGKESFARPVRIPCGVVKLNAKVQITTVRADSSASHGAAEEEIADAKILVPSTVSVVNGDVLMLYGISVEITGKQPRINTRGRLDHYELLGKIRSELP